MSSETTTRTLLPSLLDAKGYVPGLWDLRSDSAAREYWAGLFATQASQMLEILAHHQGPVALESGRRASDAMNRLIQSPDSDWLEGHSDVHGWTVVREHLLAQSGLEDPYTEIKIEANRKALARLPAEFSRLRATDDLTHRLDRTMKMLFEGNLFDHGSPGVVQRNSATPPPMRWLHDDRPALAPLLASRESGRQATVLVDNAGPDFVLGIMSLSLVLCDAGFDVVLAANATPSLNDVTEREVNELLAEIAEIDGATGRLIASGRIRAIDTGGGTPGIDLRQISQSLAESVAASDLLVLEGQGRAIETNWNARLAIPTLRIATLKDPEVARALGGSTYDFVCELRDYGADPPRRVNQA